MPSHVLHGKNTHQIDHAVLHAEEVRVGVHVMINLSICQLQDCSPLETADEGSLSQVFKGQSELLIMELQSWAPICHTASSGQDMVRSVTNLAWLQKVNEGVLQIPLHLQLLNETPPAARKPEDLTRTATKVALWVHLRWQH